MTYTFNCEQKLVTPTELAGQDCYKHMPVTPQGTGNNVLFSQARNRLIVRLGVEISCLLNFKSQCKLINDPYAIYTKDALVKSTSEYTPLSIYNQELMGILKREDQSKLSLYEYERILRWSDLTSFSTKKQTLVNAMIKEVDISKASKPEKKSLVEYFDSSTFLFDSFKSTFSDLGV